MAARQWQAGIVISGWTARRLLAAGGRELDISPDLGRTRAAVIVGEHDVKLPGGERVTKEALSRELSSPEDCARISGGACRKIYVYDDSKRRHYKLYQPVEDRPPTIIINGASMHPIVGTDPWKAVAAKVATVPRKSGECLDTCCGLGYSAQMLLRAGFRLVVTCEVDANVLDMAALNPWSEGLFNSPRIRIVQDDVREFLARCESGRFAAVFHDPPTVFQAGELYSEQLYREFARVLRRGGVLYHYVGAPGGRVGRDYARGVMRRLREAGFSGVKRVTDGVLARR